MVLFEGKNMGLATMPLFIVQGAIYQLAKGNESNVDIACHKSRCFTFERKHLAAEESTFHNQIKSKLNTISTLEPHTQDYMMSQEYFDYYF